MRHSKKAAFSLLALFCFLIGAYFYDTSAVPQVGTEFRLEGFQKGKIIGRAGNRSLVILTNNVGQTSFHELSSSAIRELLDRGKYK